MPCDERPTPCRCGPAGPDPEASELGRAYQELRAVAAELLLAATPRARRPLLAVLAWQLQSRCLRCGALLQADERVAGRETLCLRCAVDLVPLPPDSPPPDDVPF
jgi:hypothetical protein